MCGIAGIILKSETGIMALQPVLAAMAAALRHRGPDDEGLYLAPGGRAGLANRRLAIRDLSPSGHMPMGNDSETVWLTYNGELYNAGALRRQLQALGYHFRSSGDTEVVLRAYEAWGDEAIPRLRGQFALAVLDLRPAPPAGGGRLLLARDHLGIKPLYYAETPEAFLFASELKGLLASGLVEAALSPAGLVGYLRLGSVPNPLTIYHHIRALEPATCLSLPLARPDQARQSTYWQLPAAVQEPASYEAALAEVRDLLRHAVAERLVSDVPLGAFLSGGLDSSSVVALMRQATTGPIHTCSMVFDEAGFSEAQYARAVAAATGAEHFERVVSEADLLREFDNILAALDQPSVDGVNTYFVSQTARQAGLTVALSGLGGDELFGGYPNTFSQVPRVYQALRLVAAVPGGARAARGLLATMPGRRYARVHDALRQHVSPAGAYLTRRGLFSEAETRALVAPAIWQAAAADFEATAHVAAHAGRWNGRGDPFQWLSRAELRTYTHHQLLRDTDVMSMAHSLEVRVPLLDVDLVETVLRLPAAIKQRQPGGRRRPKPLLLAALGPALPPLVRQRQEKQGFTFPCDPWLRGPLQSRTRELLDAVAVQGSLRPAAVQDTYTAFQKGQIHWSRLWALLALAAVR